MPDPGLKQEIAAQQKTAQNTSKSETSLGSKTNTNASTSKSADETPKGQIYRYPLDGQADFPARMKFTIHQVDAYAVDTTELKKYWDVPLIAKAFGKSSESTTSEKAKQERILNSESRRQQGQIYKKQPTTTVTHPTATGEGRQVARTGSVNQFEINRREAEKHKQATEDTKTSNITDIKSSRVPNSPIIQLYMPQALQLNENIQYNQVDLGPGGLSAVGALNAGSSLVSAVSRGLSEGLESIFNLATGQIAGTAAQVAAARISQAIPKVGLKAAAATALQTGINPGTRMIFDRPNIREFTFTFRFIPTSAAEANQVEQIIKIFREEMYPESLDIANGIPAGYRFPNLFQVEFKFLGADARFPKMQKSYLRNCQVVYNPNGMTFHSDGHPTEIDMTLVFQEYRALAKQDIQKGY